MCLEFLRFGGCIRSLASRRLVSNCGSTQSGSSDCSGSLQPRHLSESTLVLLKITSISQRVF